MPKTRRKQKPTGRPNQRSRTRKDLLLAATRLLKQGQIPDMDAVAGEAMVSRATAYRYFPAIEDLLVEAPLDDAVPDAEELLGADDASDPAIRVDKAERALHDMCYRNKTQLRLMLAASLQRPTGSQHAEDVPLRQNRRADLIAAALAPSRDLFTGAVYRKLCAALALVFGTESMIVFEDVLSLDEKTAREVKSWAIRTLVQSALQESSTRRTRK